jgi:UDP-glucose 4-epimerase
MVKTYFITGCAGFIGSNFCREALKLGNKVIGVDNFSTGHRKFIQEFELNPNFNFYELDLKADPFSHLIKNVDYVVHFAALADIRSGIDDPSTSFDENILVTHRVLEALRNSECKKIVFASTGSVYDSKNKIASKETDFLNPQTSIYSASKVASEALIQSYCNTFNLQCWIFRFVSVLGRNYNHGHVFDFVKNFRKSNILNVLGNGLQNKSYVNVNDCISAIFLAISKTNETTNLFNIGLNETMTVKESISIIAECLNINPMLKFQDSDRGWIGDIPFILLDASCLLSLGWKPKFSIRESVIETVNFLNYEPWLFDKK